jgi:cytochrome c-type biogenesis protein CcmE
MNKLYFISPSRINTRISETVIPGEHIRIEGLVYEQTTKRPNGKSLQRGLVNVQKQERVLIYG